MAILADAILAIISFSILLYWYVISSFNYWEKRNVPFHKPVPFFGNFKDRILGKKSMGETWTDIYNKLEGHKIGGVWFINKPILFIRDPDIIKRVLVKDFSYFHDRGVEIDEETNPLSAHLFNLNGARWRTLRAKLTPTFTSGKMKMMFALMQECSHEFVDFVSEESRKSDQIEFKELLARFTTDIIGTCAFGLQFNSMKNPNSEFRTMGRRIFQVTIFRSVIFLLFQISPSILQYFRVRTPPKDVSDFFINAVQETIDYREKNNVKRNDFLQLLIELKNKGRVDDDHHDSKTPTNGEELQKDDDDFEINVNLLAAQAFVFFLAGFETSSTTMSFALHELTANPDVQEKLMNEIDSVLNETGGEITYEALKKMEYLERVINESLRKYPPVPVLFRQCNKTYKETDTGIVIEKDTKVHIPVTALHHDPKYYPDPERFDPDRFTEEEKAKRPHYVFLPFGEGPRVCIGSRFGMVQAKLGLAALLSRYELAPSARTPHPLVLSPGSFVTSSKGGIWARLIPRRAAFSTTSTDL